MMEDSAFNFGSGGLERPGGGNHDGDSKPSKKILTSPKVSSLKPPPEIEELSETDKPSLKFDNQT
jgi:hypothetical protein